MFNTHYDWCRRGKPQIEIMPAEKEYAYKSSGWELKPLQVVYADIECYIESGMKVHLPAAIACRRVWHPFYGSRNQREDVHMWAGGEECILKFLQFLDQLAVEQCRRCEAMMRTKIRLRPGDEAAFKAATVCAKCSKEFGSEQARVKMRDHCHLTGAYRQALCGRCNFALRQKRNTVSVVFHNFRNYDAHILLKRGIGQMSRWKITAIAQSREKFMSLKAAIPLPTTMTTHHHQQQQQQQQSQQHQQQQYAYIKFIDSFQFMASSLAKLVGNLAALPITEEAMLRKYPGADAALLRRKGVFPYTYFNSLDRLAERCLPPIEAFTNDLTGEECPEAEYAFAQSAWSKFGCTTFGDYLCCYLELDVNLLADVFEKFRAVTFQEDGLEATHFVSLPAISYMSAFKMTKEKIHLLVDAEMYTLFERGIRGGLTYTNKHLVTASSSTPPPSQQQQHNLDTEEEEEETVLAYVDENNLYGNALCQYLPHSEFEWITEESHPTVWQTLATKERILALPDEAEYGYLFEVDLIYPASIHELTADFPLAAESGEIEYTAFSPYMKELYRQLNSGGGGGGVQWQYKPTRKLLLTQYDKPAYIVHFVILKFYLHMGMEVRRVSRVIRFRQKPYLRPYIMYNSRRRQEAANAFEKDFYKLKNNSLFGKTMEDVRKRIRYLLKIDPGEIERLQASPLCHGRDIISRELVGLHMLQPCVKLTKPIFIGQAVLDYSKLEMYRLFYGTLKRTPLIRELTLVAGDTDSFFLEMKIPRQRQSTNNNNNSPRSLLALGRDRIFGEWLEKLDSSNYPRDHPLFSEVNKARLGCFKDETGGRDIEEMVCLRPKMYSIKLRGDDDRTSKSIKRAKGIGRSVVSGFSHADYRKAYTDARAGTVHMTLLQSHNHQVQTVTIRKRGLSTWDDKRCWLNSNTSLPFGHYRLTEQVAAAAASPPPSPLSSLRILQPRAQPPPQHVPAILGSPQPPAVWEEVSISTTTTIL